MDEITLPDFKDWADIVYSRRKDTEEALKQAFEQGVALGARIANEQSQAFGEAVHEVDQEWFDAIDKDQQEQERLSKLIERIEPLVKDVEFDLNKPLPTEE